MTPAAAPPTTDTQPIPITSPVLTNKARRGGEERDQFAADELAIVMSHYDTGAIHALHAFPRGSRMAPKLLIKSDKGVFLLKRRARGKDNPFKVAFSHAIQMQLSQKRFPLPRLIGTHRDNNSMFQWQSRIYELFEYIKGDAYDQSPEATADAGKTLARFHKLLAEHEPQYDPPQGSYHNAPTVAVAMVHTPRMLAKVDPSNAHQQAERIQDTVAFLCSAYQDAAAEVDTLGLAEWPKQIVHCDWHPGNMLFRGPHVVAVVDYDAARVQQRILDIANAALQFAMLAAGDDADQWPDATDIDRVQQFIQGYEAVQDCLLARAELRALPWLMIEALIAESVIPIAATGSFARIDGVGFLMMVERKVHWLHSHIQEIQQTVEG